MNTPIVDFVKRYVDSGTIRFHMPGHKGKPFLGCESRDITEINGADVLYSPNGIIKESEGNASALFGTAHTFYSAEGSTLAIKAMLALIAKSSPVGKRPLILAARNAHKAFVYACALLDLDVKWIYPTATDHLCSCSFSAEDAEQAILASSQKPAALYLTSPDYLGGIADVEAIAKVCHKHGVLLLVDNAHGAYLRFLSPSRHPIDLGADLCCDSAHKTLPVLTGGAYLHVSKNSDPSFVESARSALSLFASTSPSYLILQSLDLCNQYLANGYSKRLEEWIGKVDALKARLYALGLMIPKTEPLKLVLASHSYGYTGEEIAAQLRKNGMELEFCDDSYAVLMLTPENTEEELEHLYASLSALPKKAPLPLPLSSIPKPTEQACSMRRAILSSHKEIDAKDAIGRICAAPSVSCPPAVPIVMSGERITKETVELLLHYHVERIEVIEKDS